MNFAFCIFKYYPFGGMEKNFLRILEECSSRGHSITVFTMRWEGDIPSFVKEKKVNIEILGERGCSNHTRCKHFVKVLYPKLQEGKFDLVVGFNKMPFLDLYYCADVCFENISRSKPFFYSLMPRYKIFAEFERAVFSIESSTRILSLSPMQKELYIKEYKTQSERFFDVPPGVDKEKIRGRLHIRDKFRNEIGLSEDDFMLLMLGSDFKRKGVERSIRAIASLPQNLLSKAKLFIAGEGNSLPLKVLSKRLGISLQVQFTGGIKNAADYLAAADLLLHPALIENTGNAIVEALVAGVPVIASSNCGYAFHVENSGAGIVINGNTFEQSEFNNALRKILSLSKDDFRELRKKAISYSDTQDLYSRPKVIANIIERLASDKNSVISK